ncbi:hypothetical protein KAU33_14450 [Candidatus Dependentiae bacterium]|nr:hypothetical protein [Candidatus Dependentiae bacterium]
MKTINDIKKIFLFLVVLFIFHVSQLYAQDEFKFSNFDELRVPNSPALNLLGISPADINRPVTPKAFMISILESTGQSKNFALEITPYWWSSHPELTFDDYYFDKRGYGESMLQTLAISMGKTEFSTERNGNTISITRIGMGFRLNIIKGHVSEKFKDELKKFKTNIMSIQLKYLSEPDSEDSEKLRIKEEDDEVNRFSLAIEQLDKERVGWQLEFATAVTYDFPENELDNERFSRFGAWLTASYHPHSLDKLTFLGIGRYIYEDLFKEKEEIYDVGFSCILKFKQPRVLISLEYLHRFIENDDANRYVLILDYKISDSYFIYVNFGKTFNNDFKNDGDLVATIGLNCGWKGGHVVKEKFQ